MTTIEEDSEMSIFPLRSGVNEQEFRRIASQLGLKVKNKNLQKIFIEIKRERMCPSMTSFGACVLGVGIGALAVTSAANLLPCLVGIHESIPANTSNFRERRSNGKN